MIVGNKAGTSDTKLAVESANSSQTKLKQRMLKVFKQGMKNPDDVCWSCSLTAQLCSHLLHNC